MEALLAAEVKVLLIVTAFFADPSIYGTDRVQARVEQPTVEICLQRATKFLRLDPADIKAASLAATCQVTGWGVKKS